MRVAVKARQGLLFCLLIGGLAVPAWAGQIAGQGMQSSQRVRIAGQVRDQFNAITLPGVPVEVVGTGEVTYTDVDGRFTLDLPPGAYELRVAMDGYQEQTIRVEAVPGQRTVTVDVGLSMSAFTETVTVTADAPLDAVTSSAAAQLVERKNAAVISDNMGAQDMRANGDGDAATAMSRVTGLSVVDGQYVFVRGLGERYSNTTLSGSVLPTTEPDRKVVPLDIFPSGLLDSVQVAKSYSVDKSAEFAGGLVQIQPLKFPGRPVFDVSYGLGYNSVSTGRSMPLSPLGTRDFWGFDNGTRALPPGIPANKVVRRGIYTPEVGYTSDEMNAFGRLLDNRWTPVHAEGRPAQSWGATFGHRWGKVGVVASVTHSYKESYVEEQRSFYRVEDGDRLEAVTDYAFQIGTQKAQLGAVANIAYAFSPNHRVSLENFYSHGGKDEGRIFEGPNTENNLHLRNYRLQFVEEGLMSNAVSGEHFFRALGNSRIDWRATSARATRNEPDLREALYQAPLGLALEAREFRLVDKSQSGFRMFNELDDDTIDVSANWSVYFTANGRPLQLKAGPSYIRREREAASRRFRFIPMSGGVDIRQSPEQLFTSSNIGTAFRFNEETRPVDAYDARQETLAGYGMADWALSNRARIVAGVRVERFDLEVNTFDPFGLFVDRVTATLDNTDIFPSANLVYALRADMNLRLGYSQTVNRPEFRELAAFEFTDVVGNRSIRGNPALTRALIRNVDARWELFTGGRDVLAVSAFLKRFDDPIERVITGSAQPVATFENADSARNFGVEVEAARQVGRHLYFSANYTWVDSEITLTEGLRRTQTSLVRPLAGQSRNLFNAIGELTKGEFSARVLYNFFGDRISDVGASGAPDIIETGRGVLDVVLSQRVANRLNVRVSLDNLTDATHLFTQGSEDQRVFRFGRTVSVAFGYSWF